MKITETPIEGLLVIEPDVFRDSRGFFLEVFNESRYSEAGIDAHFVQDNMSMSSYGVVRGLHFQRGEWSQAKLVSCAVGCVFDVAVDLRKGSKTYGRWYGVELSDDNHRQMFIPHGFAHGFSVLSEKALFMYKCDRFFHKESEGGILLSDSDLDIDWRVPESARILSDKDKVYPRLRDTLIEF
ncbi:MAG: dTDP-4-dehydrorhamnose 3,5-epimerase [Paludibacteraceae bacterium]|nr:dTDP-4-dehydrorhamnose 3,5-epimerase [Paludibacteraceae bacterium]